MKLLEPFAKTAFEAKIQKDLILNFKEASPVLRKKQITLIDHLIDRCIRTSSNLIIPNASSKAIERAQKYGLNIFAAKDGQQSAMEKHINSINVSDKNRFRFEHQKTVSDLRNEIATAKSALEVEQILETQQVVWVLNSENDVLKKSGYHKKRLDPRDAYWKSGISVILSPFNNLVDYLKAKLFHNLSSLG